MLKDNFTLFGVPPEPNYTKINHFNVFASLGHPTAEEADALGTDRYHVLCTISGQLTEKLSKIMPKDKNTLKWMPIVEAMLNYNSQKRIKIKELLHHDMFKKYFEPYMLRLKDELAPKTTKMERIWISLPYGFDSLQRNDRIAYVKILLDSRRSILDESRRDLVVLAHNLDTATSVPLHIWIDIFILANTKPIMYLLPRKSSGPLISAYQLD